MSNPIVARILLRAKEVGLTPRAASIAAGMSATAIRDLARRPGASPSTETVRKLARALNTTPEWLAFGVPPSNGNGGTEQNSTSSEAESLNVDTEDGLQGTSPTLSNNHITVDQDILRSAIVEGLRIGRALPTIDEDRLASIVIESLSAPLVDPAVTDPVVSARIFVGLTARGAFHR